MKWYQSKEIKNAGWLIGGRITQMALSFFVGVFTARYLGPQNYGLISYVSAYVTFFSSICTLGINSIIIKNFLDDPRNQGETIGSSILLRLISSFLSIIMIVGIISIVDHGDEGTIWIAFLCGMSLLFQAFDTFNYWFQSRYQSKVVSVIILIAYTSLSIYRIVLLIFQKDIRWFALASSVDYFVVALLLIIAYKKNDGPNLSFSWKKAQTLLKSSYHYIISGALVSIYAQTDKFMIKQMKGISDVGFYSLSFSLATIWVFVLSAIIDSMYPSILSLASQNKDRFERKNKQLYAIVFYLSCIVSLAFVFFGDFIISKLYGDAYSSASTSLKIITWFVPFSYLGVARNAWVVSEGKQKYLKYIYFFAVVVNVLLNLILIPNFSGPGAAIATVITQIFTSIIFPLFVKELRPNAILMLKSISLIGVFEKEKE